MIRVSCFLLATAVLGCLMSSTNAVRADFIVSTGYSEGKGTGGSPVPPSPWYGSANTSFYGNSSDISAAKSSNPDLSAVLIQNTGTSSLTISDVKLTKFDLFTRAGLTSPVTLGVGDYAIFAAGDGSDEPLIKQTVTFNIDGNTYSAADAITKAAPNGVLFGNTPFVNGVETIPWTQIDQVPPPNTASPEPSTLTLMAVGLVGMFGFARRRRNRLAA